ncbi:hypothetical protein Tco_0057565 [Tanacetum coccineum]
MSNRHQELTSPEQTATGKDFSNPLIVDSLLKTIRKQWLSPSKRYSKTPKIRLSGCQQTLEFVSAYGGKVVILLGVNILLQSKVNTAETIADQDGVTSIPNSEIFEQLALMGYHTDSDKLTFQKGAFSPQWRFIQICLDMQRHQFQQHTRTYPVPSLSMKVFNNMKRPTKGYSGQEVALFPTMIEVTAPSTSPSRITSSPSHSPEHSPSPTPSPSPEPTPAHTTADVTQPSPTQPSPTQPSPTQPSPTQPGTEHHLPTPHDSPLHAVHSHGSDEGSLKLNELTVLVTKLSDRIGALEDDLKKTKNTYSSAYTKLILRVKKAGNYLMYRFKKKQVQTELINQEVTPTEVHSRLKWHEKASDEVSTAGAKKGTASEEVPIVSTAEVNLSTAGGTVTYSRRSAEKRSRQDSTIARDEEIARQWDEEERKRAMAEAKSTKKIDWNDPSVIRYHSLKMKPKIVAQARRNMIKTDQGVGSTLTSPITTPPLSLINTTINSNEKCLLTPKITPPPLTSPPPAPTQPSKLTSLVTINLDPIELLFSTPPSSSSLLDVLGDLPPSTTNPSPHRPSFATIELLENEPPPIPPMNSSFPLPTPELEPTPSSSPPSKSLPPPPSQLPPLLPLGPNNPFPFAHPWMFCEHRPITKTCRQPPRRK